MSLQGLVIAVSGAASGIGLATVRLLAQRGAEASKLRPAGARCTAARTDVRSARDVDEWIEAGVEAFGRLDGAENCAGVMQHSLVLAEMLRAGSSSMTPTNQSDADWGFVVDTNLGSTFRCMQARLAVVVDGGSIMNLTSTAGVQGFAQDAAYCASKHTIIGLTRAAAKERFGTADEVAQTIAFLLGPESNFTTGTVTAVDGGMTA
ncbi:hypothetical protein BKA66DRAFT_516622 [Pyrenochaeta sp. MPI-SDFR-AT-0127]|nr:hypothetical protein BKA66DRAFT_516622 [Pyrenochaeta sp. MPI-SDFR-AT-0127]